MRETYSFLLLPQKSEEGDITEKRPCYATRVVPTSSGIETPFYSATLRRMRLLFLVEGTSLPGGGIDFLPVSLIRIFTLVLKDTGVPAWKGERARRRCDRDAR